MAYQAFVVADSISPRRHRLTTMVVTLPRIVLAEFNTHRVFSRNSASSRAIPVRKQLNALLDDMFIPVEFGTAVGGMNAGPPLQGDQHVIAEVAWRESGRNALMSALMLTTTPQAMRNEWESGRYDSPEEFVREIARRLEDKEDVLTGPSMLRTSKGLTNRLLEPFQWQTIIVTATEWDNFFALRTDENAQLEIRTAAQLMLDAYTASEPQEIGEGEWHLPFIQEHELEWAQQHPEIARKAVTARCARVSYLTHDTGEANLEKDIALADRLAHDGHMSPFEHAATPISEKEWTVRKLQAQVAHDYAELLSPEAVEELTHVSEFSGNFRGWEQYRRQQKNQRVYVKPEPETAAA